MIEIDGSFGEGGGQILRTSLALSLVTGRPFHIHSIRARRDKPGLMRQHLTAVIAAAEIGTAQMEGAVIGSMDLVFRPGKLRPGSYRFSIGTAGSAVLVFQTLLPALIHSGEAYSLVLEGGTHNPGAPPFDFLEKSFLPLLRRMGARVSLFLDRPGFYPAGGGCFRVSVEPCPRPGRLVLEERGAVRRISARASVARLPVHIAERELAVAHRKLGLADEDCRSEEIRNSAGPGNVLIIEVECAFVTEVFTGFGERNVRAEVVASRLCREVHEYLKADVPVGRHLADQLILPMALGEGGSFKTLEPSDHAVTNIEIVKKFVPVDARITPADAAGACRITLSPGIS